MQLSKNLTFSVLLIAALAFVTLPVMAQVTVTMQVTEVKDGAPGPPIVRGKKVVTIKYSVNANPAPVIGDFSTGATALTATDATLAGSGDTFTLTFLGAAAGTNNASIPSLTLTGYTEVAGLDGHTVSADDATLNPVQTLVLAPNHLAGLGYAIIADFQGTGDDAVPTLPASVTDGESDTLDMRSEWAVHDGITNDEDDTIDEADEDGEMPDLYDHFTKHPGGTINLKLLGGGDDGTEMLGGVNSRMITINEVMWARDKALVGQDGYTSQQWIEIRNHRTTPYPFSDIKLTLSKDFPAPAAETDRLSNIPAFNNTWDIRGKGQDGLNPLAESGDTKVEFVSMERVNYDNGWDSGRWAGAIELFLPNYKGTPGAENRPAGIQSARTVAGATNPPKNKVIVGEIGLSNTAGHDWIELYNISDSAVNIKKWTVSLATGYNTEKIIYRFRDNDKFEGDAHAQSIPAKGHLLLVFKDPSTTPLSVGVDVRLPERDQAFGHADHKFLNVDGRNGNAVNGIPGNKEWLIIIRSNHESKFLQSSHHIQDVAGPGGNGGTFAVHDINAPNPRKDKKGDGNAGGNIWHTKVWPLQNQNHKDNFLRRTGDLPGDDTAWYRRTDKGGGQGWQHESFGKIGWTGAGYDRGVDTTKYKGSPGYPNNSHKSQVGHISDGRVIISEMMLATDGGRYPQWLELHNTSKTSSVNLTADDGWRLVIENHDSEQWAGKRDLVQTINFKKDNVKTIPPNQTILVVSTVSSRTSGNNNDQQHFPSARVYDVYTSDRANFYMANRRAPFLNTNGFVIKLIDGKGNTSDHVGNLDGNNRTYDVPYSWEWSADMTANDERSSLIRIKNEDKTYRTGVPDRDVEGDMTGAVAALGSDAKLRGGPHIAWVYASDTALATGQDTYYGSRDDHSTPGHTSNTPLPVNLSHFRPTLENGEIVIRWTTESELDNAGFNILRSDARNGEFKQVNAQIIEGQGTTGERSTYKWVDATAKPDAVYYYQIEDVSFAGEHQTLTTTKLKGLISARGKATTTWGELKEVQ